VSFLPHYDVRRIFSDSEERMLVDYLLTASKLHHGLSPKAARELAYEFAEANKKNVPRSWILNSTAGEDWLYMFMKRHAELSIRAPESTSLARSTAFNKANVSHYFDNLEDVMKRFKFRASDVHNIDETGFTTVQVPNKIVAGRGAKQVGKITSAERGTLVTVCCAVSALGNCIPPFLIFPRVYFKDAMMNGAPVGSHGEVHPSGWMTAENFVKFLQHFVSFVNCSPESPVLILMDNHDSHVSMPAIDYANNNGIIILTFTPHCSHKLQPLDRSVFGPMIFLHDANRATFTFVSLTYMFVCVGLY
jgi:DDE superfamily endonuclease